MLNDLKSLYPSLAYRLFHAGVFDTADNRNQPIHIAVDYYGDGFDMKTLYFDYASVIDVPLELLQMSCYKEATAKDNTYFLCGYPASIDGSFVLKYEQEDTFTIRSLLNSNQLPTVGIIVNMLQDDLMEVLYPSQDYKLERLPRDIYGKKYNDAIYFENMNDFLAYMTKERK